MIKKSFFQISKLVKYGNWYGFLQSKFTDQKMKELATQYKVNPSIQIFKKYIASQSDYFRIFQIIQKEPFNEQAYQKMRELTAKLDTKSDNMIMLRARLSAKIAEHYWKQNRPEQADKYFNESLQIFQTSMVPQVLPYYSVYRKYGFFLNSLQDSTKAAEVLSESVQVMANYVKHSDDPVTNNYHSTEQAKACVKLIYLQPQQREKWLKMANDYWKECQSGVQDNIEYAQTVYENAMDKKKINAKKARLYAEVQMDKIANQKYHQIILRAFEEPQK